MSSPTMSVDLTAALKRLRLGRIAESLPERLTLAEKQKLGFEELLLTLLTDEIARRDSSATSLRVSEARLEPQMTLEQFDASAKISYDKRVFSELCSLRFIEAHKHVVVLGPVGVGKTFLATALGHLACRHRYNVKFMRADDMLHALKQSRLDNSRDELMVELCTVDLLILDDFALESMTREESKDIYQLFVERTGRGSMIVTSNRDTGEWLSMFEEVLLAQSAIDRFKNAAYDLVIDGESYRPRLKPSVSTTTATAESPLSKPLRRPKR